MAIGYPVPAETLEHVLEIKKSRFIARVTQVAGREDAMAFLAQARADHPDARHHCWAYVIGKPGAATHAAASDDGEPSGTAGKPILNVIQHKGIGDVMVVVIRYFGGIKLGAGGLVRAYGAVTEQALSALRTVEQVHRVTCELHLDFAREQGVRHWAAQHDAQVGPVEYAERVRMTLAVLEPDLQDLDVWCGGQGITLTVEGRPGSLSLSS